MRNNWIAQLMLITVVACCLLSVFGPDVSQATIHGACSNCHTMHNSQGGGAMTLDDSEPPNPQLLRSTCYGCHAQGGMTPTVDMGPDKVPQVMHRGATHLAGGNFGYITGMAGSGASDGKGHNISDLTGTDAVFSGFKPPPGALVIDGSRHPTSVFMRSEILGCAGRNGCHGYRAIGGSADYFVNGVIGAHHKNVGGKLDNPTEHANSYRFLYKVKGYESSDWQEHASSGNHNEYFALSAPVQIVCMTATGCHGAPGGILRPPDGTMSQFCATCHGNFHSLESGDSTGVGSSATSPFIRHPTDLSIPSEGEYASYTTYDLDAPVARLTVPETPSSSVLPGTDAVMCLSCHVAHASDYPDMLRWDYNDMIANGGGSGGCFVCHSTKN